ncbi:MAG: hypothetical protein IJS24_05730 [Eubacterium sp.]|nr:hypothetical protein [Eubacterium sp.]
MMKKTMIIVKKAVAITFACAMALAITPVMDAGARSGHWYYRGAAEDDQTDGYKYLRGNWYYRGDGWKAPYNPEANEYIKAAVETATSDLDEDIYYEALAVLAERESEGFDYRVFCRRTSIMPGAKATYSILEIHDNLIGQPVLANIIDTDMETYYKGDPDDWNETDTPLISRQEGYIFNKAVEGLDGANYKPLGILATRTTNETDYCFIAEITSFSNNEEITYALIYINENDEGEIKLDMTKTIDLYNA